MTADSSSRAPSPEAGRAVPSRLGKYQIERELGAGGMGTVYLAVDDDLKRTVALKVLARERAENPLLVRRFKAEGQAAALLQHRNIVSVYEAGESDGHLFLALEFIDGIDVLGWMQRHGVFQVRRSVEIIRQVAEALQHAYERNIVHRDIKPSNLMISKDGVVKLTDMGLARSITENLDSMITRDGTTVGTVDYMAPEQASNSRAADIRSDIYSLGCTWFHMLTGSLPFPEGTLTNKLTAHLTLPPPDPRTINPQVPEAVTAVLHRMLAKKKEDRYQTPRDLIHDLDSETVRRGNDPINLLELFNDEPAPRQAAIKLGGQARASDPTRVDLPAKDRPVPLMPSRKDSSGAQPVVKKKGSNPTVPVAAGGNTTRATQTPAGRRALPARRSTNRERPALHVKIEWPRLLMMVLVAAVIAVAIVWGLARFSDPPVTPVTNPYSRSDKESVR